MAEDMANVTVSTDYFNLLVNKLYPIKDDMSDAQKNHIEKQEKS